MPKLRLRISMSLDGFVAGPSQSVQNPLGIGGMRLHEWAFPLAQWRAMHDLEGGEVNESSRVVEDSLANEQLLTKRLPLPPPCCGSVEELVGFCRSKNWTRVFSGAHGWYPRERSQCQPTRASVLAAPTRVLASARDPPALPGRQ